MNKKVLAAAVFVVLFAVAYLFMCYLIPGLRIKLAADSAEYFAESIKHMAGFKCAVSFVIGLLAAIISLAVKRNAK